HTLPGLSRASLLMPQMVGALFLGIMESFGADESWSLAYLSHPVISLIELIIFTAASYYFVRYGLLGDQSPWVEEIDPHIKQRKKNKILRKRSLGFLSLGLWQAFTLINLFMVLQANVMCNPSRADLLQHAPTDLFSIMMNALVPQMIIVDTIAGLNMIILPWSLFTWTVQLFFFSAIFERIMNR
ncbi:hypothetical protein JXA80_07480, partial [bacterium]|nr:hypothetical protein [candidate division CSSED10-310 bacterium]